MAASLTLIGSDPPWSRVSRSCPSVLVSTPEPPPTTPGPFSETPEHCPKLVDLVEISGKDQMAQTQLHWDEGKTPGGVLDWKWDFKERKAQKFI